MSVAIWSHNTLPSICTSSCATTDNNLSNQDAATSHRFPMSHYTCVPWIYEQLCPRILFWGSFLGLFVVQSLCVSQEINGMLSIIQEGSNKEMIYKAVVRVQRNCKGLFNTLEQLKCYIPRLEGKSGRKHWQNAEGKSLKRVTLKEARFFGWEA